MQGKDWLLIMEFKLCEEEKKGMNGVKNTILILKKTFCTIEWWIENWVSYYGSKDAFSHFNLYFFVKQFFSYDSQNHEER